MKKISANQKKMSRRSLALMAVVIAVVLIATVVAVIMMVSGSKSSKNSQISKSTFEDPELILSGEPARADLLTGSWVSFASEHRIVYTYDGEGNAVFSDEETSDDYHYEVDGDRVIQTCGDIRQVYIWNPIAKTFIGDHPHGEAMNLVALAADQIPDLYGYMYVEGDFLYIGKMVMCREETLDSAGDNSLLGTWTGAAGDRVTFTEDGAYLYHETSYDYNGSYRFNDDGTELTLSLQGQSDFVLLEDDWDLNGRVLRIRNQYYFRDEI